MSNKTYMLANIPAKSVYDRPYTSIDEARAMARSYLSKSTMRFNSVRVDELLSNGLTKYLGKVLREGNIILWLPVSGGKYSVDYWGSISKLN